MSSFARTFLIAAALCLCAPHAQAASQVDEEAALTDAERSVVRVSIIERTETGLRLVSYGSGFVVAPGVVATNFHVISKTLDDANALRSNMRVLVTPTPGSGAKAAAAEPRWFVSASDLALLTAPDLTAPPLPIARDLPGKTDRVRALGYPGQTDDMLRLSADEILQSQPPYPTTGQIALLSDRAVGGQAISTIFHTASISRGNSGGPLVDACGRLIGVNTWAGGSRVEENGYVAAAGSHFVATRRENLTQLLADAAIAVTVDAEPCALGGVGSTAEVEQKLSTLDTQLAQAQREVAETQRENAAVLREARETRQNTLNIAIGALAAVAVALVFLWRRGRPSKVPQHIPPQHLPPMDVPLQQESPAAVQKLDGARAPLRLSTPMLAVVLLVAVVAVLIVASTLTWR